MTSLKTPKLDLKTVSGRSLRRIFRLCIILALGIYPSIAVAQSADRDNPAQMKDNTASGELSASENSEHFYSFIGGPGVVTITADGASPSLWQYYVDVLGEDARSLSSFNLYDIGKSLRRVVELKIPKRQKITLQINARQGNPTYKIRVSGAVSVPNSDQKPISDQNTSTLACLGKRGTIQIKMIDGSVSTIDLSKTSEITLLPQ